MISVKFTGQLGNQLTQFCVGKILAEKLKQPYMPASRTWLDKKGRPVKWSGPQFIANPTPSHGQAVYGTPVQVLNCNNFVDFDAIDPKRPVRLSGYFQRYDLFRDWKDRIRNDWLRLQVPFLSTDPAAVYVHVRRTDYVGHHLNTEKQCTATRIEDYAAALKEFPDAKRLVLVSDAYADPFLRKFTQFGLPIEHANGTWSDDFMLLASCRNMIMSQSTYSWWAGFLGRAEKIVCPMAKDCFWGRSYLRRDTDKDAMSLHVDDEPRFEWLVTE